MTKGIIFDFDGVIVDSISGLFTLYDRVINKLGANSTGEDISNLNGLSVLEICEHIKNIYEFELDKDEIYKIYNEELSLFYKSCPVNFDVVKVIRSLDKNNYKLSIGSSCSSVFIHEVLTRLDLNSCVQDVTGGDMIEKGKPSPEVFLTCMQRSGFDSALVVDDGFNGVVSAVKAKCSVIKYDDYISYHEDLESFIIHSYDNNISYLGKYSGIDFYKNNKEYSPSKEDVRGWSEFESLGCYNAPMIIFDDIKSVSSNKLVLKVTMADYKYYKSSFNDAIAMAVTGIVYDKNGRILIGKRSAVTEQFSGLYDFVPAGSLENYSIYGQLDAEWEEEVGLDTAVDWSEDVTVLLDHDNLVMDLCIKGRVDEFSISNMNSKEVDDYQLTDRVVKHNYKLTPTAELLLNIL